MDWTKFIMFLGIVNALCIASDKLVLNRYKGVIYNFLLSRWVTIDDYKIPEFHKIVARQTTRFITYSNGKYLKTWPLRLLLYSYGISGIALLIGLQVQFGNLQITDEMLNEDLSSYFNLLMFFVVIIYNYIFDFITIFITLKILNTILNAKLYEVVTLIIVDFFFACVVSILSAYIFLYIALLVGGDSVHGISVLELSFEMIKSILSLNFEPVKVGGVSLPTAFLFFICTIFIPTVMFVLLLALLIIVKLCIQVIKYLFQYFIEKALEVDDPKKLVVFTILGTVISVVSLILRLVIGGF